MNTIIKDASKFKFKKECQFEGVVRVIKSKVLADGTEVPQGQIAISQEVDTIKGNFLQTEKRPGWITGDLSKLKALKLKEDDECPYEVKVVLIETTEPGDDQSFSPIINPQTGAIVTCNGQALYHKYVTEAADTQKRDVVLPRDSVKSEASMEIKAIDMASERTF